MATDLTLLPPNATELERALEAAAARIEGVPIPLAQLWDPETCAPELLPWIAWGLSVDNWDPEWPLAQKREAVASSIDLHRKKATPASIDAVLSSFDDLLELVEWFEASPRAEPHTFEVHLPLVTAPGLAPGGERSRAAFAEAIVRDVTRIKRLSQHFRLIQKLTLEAFIRTVGAAQFTTLTRLDGAAAHDPSPDWLTYLQTERGEPLQDEAGAFLEDV